MNLENLGNNENISEALQAGMDQIKQATEADKLVDKLKNLLDEKLKTKKGLFRLVTGWKIACHQYDLPVIICYKADEDELPEMTIGLTNIVEVCKNAPKDLMIKYTNHYWDIVSEGEIPVIFISHDPSSEQTEEKMLCIMFANYDVNDYVSLAGLQKNVED